LYVAHPRAKSPGTDFKLVRSDRRQAVFENLSHDFPKRKLPSFSPMEIAMKRAPIVAEQTTYNKGQ
jgi:hypothetical protein